MAGESILIGTYGVTTEPDRSWVRSDGDATTPEDVGATSSSEESSYRVSETPYAH